MSGFPTQYGKGYLIEASRCTGMGMAAAIPSLYWEAPAGSSLMPARVDTGMGLAATSPGPHGLPVGSIPNSGCCGYGGRAQIKIILQKEII